MIKLKAFLSKNRHFFVLLLLIPLLIWFRFLEMTITPKYIMEIWLDDKIPFVKEFIVPYILWFPFIGFGVVYTGLYSKKNFYKLVFFLGAGMSVAYTIYMIFPNGQMLRPTIVETDIFSTAIRLFYMTDTPTNVCPSLHVMNSIAVYGALSHTEKFVEKGWRKGAAFVLTVLICLSTVFIKQHSAIDGFAGIVVALLFYVPLYEVPKLKERNAVKTKTADF